MTNQTLYSIINSIYWDEDPLPVVIGIKSSGLDSEEPDTLAHTTTSIRRGAIIVTVFKEAIERYGRNVKDSLRHEAIHVSQLQTLYAEGGWKFLKAARAYEVAKWVYYNRPSEIDAYGGGVYDRYQYLSFFKTSEFKRFLNMVAYYDDEELVLNGHFVFS